jgi:hypothetical protein
MDREYFGSFKTPPLSFIQVAAGNSGNRVYKVYKKDFFFSLCDARHLYSFLSNDQGTQNVQCDLT